MLTHRHEYLQNDDDIIFNILNENKLILFFFKRNVSKHENKSFIIALNGYDNRNIPMYLFGPVWKNTIIFYYWGFYYVLLF